MDIYFSDYFNIQPEIVEEYGAFNISLVTDLPLFIDPFLLFNSKKPAYQELHQNILKYLRFLKQKAGSNISKGLLKHWYCFPEVKQNWLGYCENGNGGNGLGMSFANALNSNLSQIFMEFGNEEITKTSHLEKLCIIKDNVGRDNISDFTTNLIHEYLLDYTQAFAQKYLDKSLVKRVVVQNVRFNYVTETWERDTFELPWYGGNYVLLTPCDMLTKDDTWISKMDLIRKFETIPDAFPNEELRAQVNNYFLSLLPEEPSAKDKNQAVGKVITKYPEIVDYYIKIKEDMGAQAEEASVQKVIFSRTLYVEQFKKLADKLYSDTAFYSYKGDTYEESLARALFLKDVIENNDGYRVFYHKGLPIKREEDLQILYKLTWFASPSDVNREVNNGRGPVDFKISRGNKDKTLIEFKLANNTHLKKNLQNQVAIYEKANDTKKSIKVIIFFSEVDMLKAENILKDLNLVGQENIILIDARKDNKPSASVA